MSDIRTTRFSGADWADQLREIMVIGAGGISSWTILNLARIGHELFICDPDTVDDTNVTGGQMYRSADVGKKKVHAVADICRSFGCVNTIVPVDEAFSEEMGMVDIVICGLDNMAARRQVFEAWCTYINYKTEEERSNCLFIDGRLTIDMWECFTIKGSDSEDILTRYNTDHLFQDEEANAVDCTTKQSTFGAMGIASFITGTLCNFLTNTKNMCEIREVPFYQRIHLPMMQQKHSNQVEQVRIEERIIEVEKIVEMPVASEMVVGVQEAYSGELEKLRNFHAVVGALHGAALIPKPQEVHVYGKPINENVWSNQ